MALRLSALKPCRQFLTCVRTKVTWAENTHLKRQKLLKKKSNIAKQDGEKDKTLQKLPIVGEVLDDFRSITLALTAQKRSFNKLYVRNRPVKDAVQRRLIDDIIHTAEELSIPMEILTKDYINLYTSTDMHRQNVFLDAGRLQLGSFNWNCESGLQPFGNQQLWVWLHQVKDPMNLGSVIRSAYLLGVNRLFLPLKDRAPLSPTVSRASDGLMEAADIYEADFFSLVKDMKVQGDWMIVGGVTGSPERNISIHEFHTDKHVLLLLGSESKGLDQELLDQCDRLVHVEQPVNTDGADSLNVSVAASILFHRLGLMKQYNSKRLQEPSAVS